MYHVRKSSGFTLIELMLAMTFVSILLIAIAMLTIQVSNMYTRGVTLRQVNEAGLEISSDIQRSLRQANDVQLQLPSSSYVPQEGIGGRLCLGDFSYVWNTAEALSDETATSRRNKITTNPETYPSFVKVIDRGKQLCQPIMNGAEIRGYPDIDPDDQPTDMLLAGDRDLAVHNITVRPSLANGLAMVEVIVGTKDLNAIEDGTCRPPADLESNQEYCAVNKFVIVTRTGN